MEKLIKERKELELIIKNLLLDFAKNNQGFVVSEIKPSYTEVLDIRKGSKYVANTGVSIKIELL